jgi:hypothetical protein
MINLSERFNFKFRLWTQCVYSLKLGMFVNNVKWCKPENNNLISNISFQKGSNSVSVDWLIDCYLTSSQHFHMIRTG